VRNVSNKKGGGANFDFWEQKGKKMVWGEEKRDPYKNGLICGRVVSLGEARKTRRGSAKTIRGGGKTHRSRHGPTHPKKGEPGKACKRNVGVARKKKKEKDRRTVFWDDLKNKNKSTGRAQGEDGAIMGGNISREKTEGGTLRS